MDGIKASQRETDQLIIVFSPFKAWWILVLLWAISFVAADPIAAGVILVIALTIGFAQLKPIRVTSSGAVGSLGVLRGLRWEWWSSDQVSRIEYSHWPWMLRGTARLSLTTDGERVKLPGTTGSMLWRPPKLAAATVPKTGKLRLVTTRGLLHLVQQNLKLQIDTAGAEWMSPERPE